MADYDVAKAFEEIEEELISSMIRNLKRHKAEETKEGIQWTQWQALQIKALEDYKAQNQKMFGRRFSTINQNIQSAIQSAYEQGGADQEIDILKAISNGFKNYHYTGNTETTGEFFRTNSNKMDALIKATTNDMQKAETAVLRMANDQYRKIIFNAQVYANSGAGTYKQAVDMATRDFLSAGINCIQYKNGRRVNIKSYAEMAIRTANKRAYLTGEGEKRMEWGISTVIVQPRGNPCPLCLPFVGKVLIDDVWSGGKPDGKHKLMSEAIAAGLYHPNCKDVHTTYFDELSDDEVKDADEQDRDNAVDDYNNTQKRNYAETQAEKYDRLSKHSLDESKQKKYEQKAEEWKEKANTYEIYVPNENVQYYRPVIYDEDNTDLAKRAEKEIKVYKVKDAINNIFMSKSVKMKPKAFHKFDMQISSALKMLGEDNNPRKPKIFVLDAFEMGKSAVASYAPIENILYINNVIFNKENLYELQKYFVCPENEISTILHELIHWQDADKYKRKFGEITDFKAYNDYLNKKIAPKLAKLQKKGYNIGEISNYAREQYRFKKYDETYTEYRVKKLLKGVTI